MRAAFAPPNRRWPMSALGLRSGPRSYVSGADCRFPWPRACQLLRAPVWRAGLPDRPAAGRLAREPAAGHDRHLHQSASALFRARQRAGHPIPNPDRHEGRGAALTRAKTRSIAIALLLGRDGSCCLLIRLGCHPPDCSARVIHDEPGACQEQGPHRPGAPTPRRDPPLSVQKPVMKLSYQPTGRPCSNFTRTTL